MHELSMADAIVSVAAKHADGRRVALVEVKVGRLRQVVPSALEFAFELVSEGTPVEGAELRIEEVPVHVVCQGCGAESRVAQFPFACASCDSLDVEVRSGDELLVDALELVNEPIAQGAALRRRHQDARVAPVSPSEMNGPERSEFHGVVGGRS
jgi:hydrogenase nickel incorporation protein HypA/HybF